MKQLRVKCPLLDNIDGKLTFESLECPEDNIRFLIIQIMQLNDTIWINWKF